ncbi:MAG: SH3 domain-containing protein [Hyphomicrobiaceae bacterium]
MMRWIAAFILVLVPGVAQAAPERLSEADLRRTLPGAHLEIDAPLGMKLPVRFLPNGLMEGTAGELAGYLGAARDRGRWWVAQDELCAKWFRWFEAQSRCIKVWRDGDRIHWQETKGGDSGTATLIAAADAKPAVEIELAEKPGATETRVAHEPVKRTVARAAVADSSSVADSGAGTRQDVAGEAAAATAAQTIIPSQDKSSPRQDRSLALAAASATEIPIEIPATSVKPVIVNAGAAGEAEAVAIPLPRGLVAFSAVAEAARAATTAAASVATARWPEAKVERSSRQAAAMARRPSEPFEAYRSASQSSASMPEIAMFRVTRVDASDVLNVRSGPSEYHAAVGVIPPNSRSVRVVGRCRDAWCPVRHGRTSGWVNSYYLADIGIASATRIGLR